MMVMAQRQIPTKHVCQLAAIITNTMTLIMTAIITNTMTLIMTTWNVFSKGIMGTMSQTCGTFLTNNIVIM